MDTATSNLEHDHEHILRLISVMECIVGSENPNMGHIEKIVDIIKNYADGLHHAKEEKQLFPFLARRGFSPETGPVAVMMHEHEQGREYVKGITENVSLYMEGNHAALKEIYTNMSGYAALLRSHIGKENNILFRMADRALSDADQKELLKKFEKAEREQSNGSASADYIGTISSLALSYGV